MKEQETNGAFSFEIALREVTNPKRFPLGGLNPIPNRLIATRLVTWRTSISKVQQLLGSPHLILRVLPSCQCAEFLGFDGEPVSILEVPEDDDILD